MEVSAKFLPRSCFFSGDVVRCIVEFKVNRTSGEADNKNGANPNPMSPPICLAWASAQIQCECVTADQDSSAKKAGKTATQASAATSFRPVDWLEGAQIMSSSPRVLFCEASLGGASGAERKVVEYAEQLPPDLPPSHRGRRIRINYHLLVATQALGAAVSVLKLPFRVLNTPVPLSSSSPSPRAAAAVLRAEPPVAVATSPFLKDDQLDIGGGCSSPSQGGGSALSPLEGLLHIQRKPVSYDISTASLGCLAKLCLPRVQFRLGEEVLASLRFPAGAAARCVQYSVALVYTETVTTEPGPDDESDGSRKSKTTCQTKVIRHQDFTYGAEESFFNLEVPHSVTPTFRTASCRLEWHLHFEFVIEAATNDAKSTASTTTTEEEVMSEWNAPRSLRVHTLEWDLPVSVLPADPALLGHLLLSQTWSKRAVALDSSAASITSS